MSRSAAALSTSAPATSLVARLVWPVWSFEERRPRALVRIALWLAALALALTGAMWLFAKLGLGGSTIEAVALAVSVQAIVVAVVSAIAARVLDRRPASEALGLSRRPGYWLDVAFGVVLGGICMGVIGVVESALGWARYTPRIASSEAALEALPAIGSAFSLFVAVSVFEEIGFRGYLVPNVREMLPRRVRPDLALTITAMITSIAFGVAHRQNPNVSHLALAYIAFAGLFLMLGRAVQGDLAIPFGVHLGWNFFQNFLGMEVSGSSQFLSAALLAREELGPDVATGGPFGPEAGLEGLFAMVLGVLFTLAWLRARTGPLEVHPNLVDAAASQRRLRDTRMAP